MYSINLEIFKEIQGIGSASGIISKADLLYIIGDNSGYLNEFNIKSEKLRKIQVLSDSELEGLENIPKPQKPDFEVLCHYADRFYILGSGSTSKRNLMVEFDTKSQRIGTKDLTSIYQKMKVIAKINDENFNIEGAVFNGQFWLLFNRENGNDGKNGIFRILEKDLAKAEKITFTSLKLANINHVESSFTDAVLVNKDVYFISTAEDTKSTYTDGDILGSFIGSINPESLKLNFSYRIPGLHKFEGISLFRKTASTLEFLLCEDRDTDELKTTVYKLRLSV